VAHHINRGTALFADRHSPLFEGLRVLLEDCFEAVIMVVVEASLHRTVDRVQPATSSG